MTYNPENTEPLVTADLPKDSVLEGTIIDVQDGQIKDFVSEKAQESWKGSTDQTAINSTIEISIDGKTSRISQVFTYIDDEGKTKYTKSSNLGRFVLKYGHAPKAGLAVMVITNSDGYGRVKLD